MEKKTGSRESAPSELVNTYIYNKKNHIKYSTALCTFVYLVNIIYLDKFSNVTATLRLKYLRRLTSLLSSRCLSNSVRSNHFSPDTYRQVCVAAISIQRVIIILNLNYCIKH